VFTDLIAKFLIALATLAGAASDARLEILLLAILIVAGALGLLILLRWDRRRRLATRPEWARMLADTDYFKQSVWRIFRARGYKVQWARAFNDPIERQPRDVVFALTWRGELVVAVCGRWVIPITSDVITRFQQALATTQAKRGMIVTTSFFTDAAKAAAIGLPVELHDREQLARWMTEIWG
jgi:HJR/Mrr/RecB family endonuclease